MSTHIHQAGNQVGAVRPQAVPQGKSREIAGGSRQALQLSAVSDTMKNSPRALQLRAMQGMMRRPAAPVIQRKEETTLQPGKLNMIGETHTDYAGEKERMYESKKIRETLAGAKYFTEGMLKTTPGATDYSDPVHLRLEQAIAFVKAECDPLLPELKSFETVSLDEALQANAEMAIELATVVGKIAPMITRGDDNGQIMAFIKAQNYAIPILEKLSQAGNWNFEKDFDVDNNHTNAFFGLIDLIIDERYSREDEVADDEDNGEADVRAPLILGEALAYKVRDVYAKYKGRLPPNLALYYHFKSQDLYAGKEHFRFFPGAIQPAMAAWNKIEVLDGLLKELIDKKRYESLPAAISAAHRTLSSLIQALDDGMLAGQQARSATDVCLARSKAMHQAATAQKGELIAWKVGDLHVKDIRTLESAGKISTEYAYLDKQVFKDEYLDADEMKAHVMAVDDADVSYGVERDKQKVLRDTATEKLAEDSPAKAFNARLLDTVKRASGIGGWTFTALKRSGFYLTLWDAETNPRIDWNDKPTQVAMDNKLRLLESYLRVLHLIHRSGTAPELLLANADQATRRKLELDSDFIRDRRRFNDLLAGEPAAFIQKAPDLGDSMKRAFSRVLVEVASSDNSRTPFGLFGGFLSMFS